MPYTFRYDPESYERETTIGDKIVETMHAPPFSSPFKVGQFVVSSGSSKGGTTLHGGVGGGKSLSLLF